MKEILFDDLLKKIPNKYMLTIVAGKRARDIIAGSPVLVKISEKETIVRKVCLEILEDKIGVEDEVEKE